VDAYSGLCFYHVVKMKSLPLISITYHLSSIKWIALLLTGGFKQTRRERTFDVTMPETEIVPLACFGVPLIQSTSPHRPGV
jgi:hypothetical protein